MKRLSLKSLRISSHHKDGTQSGEEFDEAADHGPPRPTLGASDQEGTEMMPGITRLASEDSETPGTPKKREKKGFFKTLKRKLTGNFRGKRDSVTGVVIEDDSSSDNRDDGSLHCTGRAFNSPRKPHHSVGHRTRESSNEPAIALQTPLADQEESTHKKQHQQLSTGKSEVSKSEESSSTPTEEEKVQTVFLTDAEYGHASAPFNVNVGTAPTALTSATISEPPGGTEIGPSSVVVCRLPEEEQESDSADQAWPSTPPPPPPEMEAQAAISSDSDTQGACAPKSYSQPDDSDIPPSEPPPPPPTASTSSQGNVYEPYDVPPEKKVPHNAHLALVGGGLNDRDKLLPVYDQLKEPPKSWSLTRELFKLSKYGWYWGPITRVEAEEKLVNQTDGAFLVRDSSDERYLLSLSFRSYGRTLHTRIEHCNGVFSFYAQPESEGYFSIVDLIEHSMNDSQTGVFCYSRARTPGSPSFPVRLTKPVSRFTQVRSLQYLCRFVIRQYTRFDHIQKLPLPTQIRGWLEENQY